jgi:hypothetical protein
MGRLAVALLLVVAGCERDNGAYCDVTRPCASGSPCNLATNACEVGGGPDQGVDLSDGSTGDLAGADLKSACSPACQGVAPICVSTSCVGCDTTGDGELACSTLTNDPHCATSGPWQGSCVQCRTSGDCSGTTPACDPNDLVCRACAADGDCPSKVCDLTYASPTEFTCRTKVIYVDCQNGMPTNDGKSLGAPLDKISSGVAAAKSNNYDTVRVTGNCAGENLVIMDANLLLVGDTGAAIKYMNGNNPALAVAGNSNLVVRNFLISGGAGGNKGSGIQCTTSGSLTVLDCTINNNLQWGIDASMCAKLQVERSTIGGSSVAQPNSVGGLLIGHNFHIVNNFIVHNGSATANGGGVQITSGGGANPANFVNNTVADNLSMGINAGVFCMNPYNLVNDILFDNKQGAASVISESNCTLSFCASDDPRDALTANVVNLATTPPAFVGGDDYHLQPTSPCIDKGMNIGFPAHDYDGQPRPDPKTGKVDIGADEVE